MKFLFCLILGAALISGLSLRAEDWKTTDGEVYKNVQVIKADPDAITILHEHGGALVPLDKLPPDLQKRFNYDPDAAKAAADARAKSDAENAQALQAEMDRAEQQRQEALIAQNPNPPSETNESSGSTRPTSTSPLASASDSSHHTMGELVDTSIKLRWDHSYGDDHFSMGALFSPTQHLTAEPDSKHHSTGELFAGDDLGSR